MTIVALSRRGYCRTLSVRMVGSSANLASSDWSAVLRIRRLRRRELDLVVHEDRRPVAQLEGAQDDHLLPGGHPFFDGHEVTTGDADARELLARDLGRPAIGALHRVTGLVLSIFDDVDGIAVRGAHDRRRR